MKMRFFSVRCRTVVLTLLSLVVYGTLKIFITSTTSIFSVPEAKQQQESLENQIHYEFIETGVVQQVREILETKDVIKPNGYQIPNQDEDGEASQAKNEGKENAEPTTVPVARNVACDEKHLQKVPKSVHEKCHSKSCKEINCHNMLHSPPNSSVYTAAKKWMVENRESFPSTKQLESELRNCDSFKQSRGYHLEALSEEEANFPIAYNIIMHKDLSQVEKLLRVIYRPQNVYCIHVDAKVAKSFLDAVHSLTNCFPNVFVASKLERIVYAGFSRLQADINCMKDLVQRKYSWRYLINLAGQALPLKSNAEIVKILQIYNGSNDIEGIIGKRILKARFEREWREKGINTSFPTIVAVDKKRNPPPPDDIAIVRGSAYGVFSRQFVEFVLTDSKAQHLLEWSRTTYSPDEHYWATLHHTYANPHIRSPGSFSGIPTEKPWLAVFVAWGGVNSCHGMFKRGTCVFGVADLPALLPRHELFANKFYENHQPFALECLNEWIEYKSTCANAVPFDYKYYKSLPFIKKE